ncbi:MAG: hypothetical protein CVV21_10415 [Candidatus Goldiibacteriota bacterium HGW-Goldbacteria-1]|jgi:hypothetical protein|nr:MAG: hypothetical protein CVV21_10415 [Candidatus Goldiibacteriota bacterium HGW-Goldbacteria-1]
MGKNHSVNDVCGFFWNIEKKYNLLNRSINGIYIWQALRIDVYYKLTAKIGLFTPPAPPRKKTIMGRALKLLTEFYYFVFNNPFLKTKNTDTAVLLHPRKISRQDIYSSSLLKEFKRINKDIYIFDVMGSPENDYVTFDPYKKAAHIWAVINKKYISLSPADLEVIKNIEQEIYSEYAVRLDLLPLIKYNIINFKFLLAVYRKFLRQKKVKKLYVVVGYVNTPLIAAAKSVNTEVIELQHGIITKYHLGYSYPDKGNIHYMPDKLLCFGKYWYESTPLPSNTKTAVLGAPFILEPGKKYSAQKEKNSVLFVSQGVIGEKLFNFALQTAKILPSYNIKFNPHPSENYNDYEKLFSENTLKNFSLTEKKYNIFELLAMSEYQAGVFSTTLFEGMVLNTKIILIDMAGSEYMAPVIEKKDAILVKTPEELALKINTAGLAANISDYYAQPADKITDL